MKPSIVIISTGVPIQYPEAPEVLFQRQSERGAVASASIAMARAELCKSRTEYWRPVMGVGVSLRQIVVRTPSELRVWDFMGAVPPLDFMAERVRLALADPKTLPLGGIGRACPPPLDVLVNEYLPVPGFGPPEWTTRLIAHPNVTREVRQAIPDMSLLPIDGMVTAGQVLLRDKIQRVVKSPVAFWDPNISDRVVKEAFGQGPLIMGLGLGLGMPRLSEETMAMHWEPGAKTAQETRRDENLTLALMNARQDGDTYSGPLYMHPGFQAAMVAAGYDFPPNADVRDVVRSARSLN